ncbi:hypothetical protein LINPERPRIM_LOCUS40562 [Linum perenne]
MSIELGAAVSFNPEGWGAPDADVSTNSSTLPLNLKFLRLKVCFFLTHPSLQSSSLLFIPLPSSSSPLFTQLLLHSPSILPTAMGGDQKLTTMVMKVDLDCIKCRKKIKRVLCGIPRKPLCFCLIYILIMVRRGS